MLSFYHYLHLLLVLCFLIAFLNTLTHHYLLLLQRILYFLVIEKAFVSNMKLLEFLSQFYFLLVFLILIKYYFNFLMKYSINSTYILDQNQIIINHSLLILKGNLQVFLFLKSFIFLVLI